MGLFNFLKSKNQREQKELMQKMQQLVFPGGNEQINREIREVRELLNFKYSLDEVKQMYIHAAAMYVIDTDKSEERVIKSILYNDRSVVTKDDAIKIYKYLAGINNPKNSLEHLSQSLNKLDDCTKLFLTAKGGIVELKKYRDLTNEGKFEAILFNSIFVLGHYENEYPDKYPTIYKEYIESLINQANNFNLLFETDELVAFINARLSFYSQEVDKLYGPGQYMPSKIFNAFYENPLSDEPEISKDNVQVITFYAALILMMNWINKNLNKIQLIGISNVVRNKQVINDLEILVAIAEQGVASIENNYRPASTKGKFEIYMLNFYIGWMYFSERDQIDTSTDIGFQKLLKLFEYSQKQNIAWGIGDLIDVCYLRFRFYRDDLSGLQKSNYPETKQYFPVYIFNSIYYQPLSKDQDLSWADFNNEETFDADKHYELSKFTSVLISQINNVFKELKQ